MGGGLSTRITYWTGTWDPAKEAISKEVELLRSLGGRRQPVVSFSAGQTAALDIRSRVARLPARSWPLLRTMAPLLEWQGDLNHVFGGLKSWHLLQCVRHRPTVLTVCLPGRPRVSVTQANVDVFVAESESLIAELDQAGVPKDRVRLIYPGVDLHEYRPGSSPPLEPFRLLFASSPSDANEFEARGLPLLIEAARLCPEITVLLLWREWGDQDAARRALDRLAPPPNVRLEYRQGRDMPTIYRDAHAVVSLYANGFGKSCPNSIIEGLACGIPAIVADTCGIATLIASSGAGVVTGRDPAQIAEAARAVRRSHHGFARAARQLAERAFDVRDFLEAYIRLYGDLRLRGSRSDLALVSPGRNVQDSGVASGTL
jgi:glycosyltransferase involved in cell wall biosynthesis